MTSGGAYNEYISGAIAGLAGLVVGHPLDTTKVQMQTGNVRLNTWSTVKHLNNHGWRGGFLRGLSLPVASYALTNSILFGVYNNILRLTDKQNNNSPGINTSGCKHNNNTFGSCTTTAGHDSAVAGFHNTGTEFWQRSEVGLAPPPSITSLLLAGSIAGLAQLSVACPVDVVKVILQSQLPSNSGGGLKVAINLQGMATSVHSQQCVHANSLPGPAACLRALLQDGGGVRGCYRGLGIMALRDVPASALYFVIYESINRQIRELSGHHRSSLDQSSETQLGQNVPDIAHAKNVLNESVSDSLQNCHQTDHCKTTGLVQIDDLTLGHGIRAKTNLTEGVKLCEAREVDNFSDTSGSRKVNGTEIISGESLAASLVAGGVSGVVTWAVVMPFDVIKSHVQADYKRRLYPRGARDCARVLYSAGGWKAFYAGLTPCLLRAFPTNAVILTVNSECLRMMASY